MPMPSSPLARLGAFRTELHACFTHRADALVELSDALLSAQAVPSLPHLSLELVHQRGWGSAYAALARGRIQVERLRDLLASHLLPAGGPVPLFVFDAGYDSAQLTLDLADAPAAVLVRLRADRCFYADPPPPPPGKPGRPRRHGGYTQLRLARQVTCDQRLPWERPRPSRGCHHTGCGGGFRGCCVCARLAGCCAETLRALPRPAQGPALQACCPLPSGQEARQEAKEEAAHDREGRLRGQPALYAR
jgi:DDE superfamily endonuclease